MPGINIFFNKMPVPQMADISFCYNMLYGDRVDGNEANLVSVSGKRLCLVSEKDSFEWTIGIGIPSGNKKYVKQNF